MVKDRILEKMKNIRIRTLSYSILIIGCVILIVLGIGVFRVSRNYRKLITSVERYVQSQEAVQDLSDSSAKLSSLAKEYVVTMDASCVEEYFAAAEEKESKLDAVYNLRLTLFINNGDIGMALGTVMSDSNQIMDLQIHSMKLITMLKGYDMSQMPQELQDYEISPEEAAYTDKELQDAAYYLLFDDNYVAREQQLKADTDLAWEKITQLTLSDKDDCAEKLSSIIHQQEFCMVILFLMVVFLFLMIAFFVVRPLDEYIDSIEEQHLLKASGARELRYLAETYNHAVEMNAMSKVELAHEAEHDGLTDLMNRGAFDKLRNYLKEVFEPMALILVDVDNFKGVNDNYGHECGDKALKKVAGLLKEHFRADDYPARIGGDEFAVIMTKITPKDKDVIRKKINEMNAVLGMPGDGIPKLSVSVGIAFSQIGYNDELYSMADSALYKTKENGKCGYTFYGDWKES